ncbi:MAG: AbrB/MazE/SpoVT family DNA-binding domain-containing protein [Pseudomonadota bacterium]|nr:AbrB/MazE/SpoVT family DNA-binding domain-containing protein [Pseudomonadota bacterium]
MSTDQAVAKLFWTGRSQALRLPKAFRFEGDAVRIRRQGNAVVLEPLTEPDDPWAWIRQFPAEFDPEFEKYALEEVPQQERPELDDM